MNKKVKILILMINIIVFLFTACQVQPQPAQPTLVQKKPVEVDPRIQTLQRHTSYRLAATTIVMPQRDVDSPEELEAVMRKVHYLLRNEVFTVLDFSSQRGITWYKIKSGYTYGWINERALFPQILIRID